MLNKKNISQRSTVCALQLHHATFYSLDNVTFSRWVNNKTTPSLEKQLIIARYFEQDLNFFIQEINEPTPSNNIMDTYNKIFNFIDNTYHKMSYKKQSNDRRILNLINVEKHDYNVLLGDFYKQMEVYNRISTEMDASEHNMNTTVFMIKQQGKIISHISVNKDFRQFIPYIKQKVNYLSNSKSIFINVGHYSSRDNYEILIGHLFCYIIEQHENTEYCYILTRTQLFINLLEQLGGTVVVIQQEYPKDKRLCLLQFNLSKLLGQPFVFKKIKASYLSYCELKYNFEMEI